MKKQLLKQIRTMQAQYINELVAKLDAAHAALDNERHDRKTEMTVLVQQLLSDSSLTHREQIIMARALMKATKHTKHNITTIPAFVAWSSNRLTYKALHFALEFRRMADEAIKAATPTGVEK